MVYSRCITLVSIRVLSEQLFEQPSEPRGTQHKRKENDQYPRPYGGLFSPLDAQSQTDGIAGVLFVFGRLRHRSTICMALGVLTLFLVLMRSNGIFRNI